LQRYGINPEIGGKNPGINQENFLCCLFEAIKVISNNESAKRIVHESHEKHEIPTIRFFVPFVFFVDRRYITVFADIKQEKLLSICCL